MKPPTKTEALAFFVAATMAAAILLLRMLGHEGLAL